jgi:hypothetical protein
MTTAPGPTAAETLAAISSGPVMRRTTEPSTLCGVNVPSEVNSAASSGQRWWSAL